MVFTFQYRQDHFFLISFLATCIYIFLFYIIFTAIEIQCDYLYDGNMKHTHMSEFNVDAELCSKDTTKMTAFVIKSSLRLLRILNIFLLYFQKYFESANSVVAFIKMVIMLTFLLVFHTS